MINQLLYFDNKILNACAYKIKNRYFDKIMPFASYLNDYGKVYILVSILLVFSAYTRHEGLLIMGTLIIALLAGEVLIKNVARRNRPNNQQQSNFKIKKPISYSFPSGHATSSFSVFWVSWYLSSDLKYVFLILAIIISFSRVYLYFHYPTDILIGIILGLLCAKLAVFLSKETFFYNSINQIYTFFTITLKRL